MSRTVEEVMNREVFTLLPHERAGDAAKYLVSLGITGCPVISAEGPPVGHVSLHDLACVDPMKTVGEYMTSPARTIRKSDTIAEAGHRLAAQSLHRLIVVNDQGIAVGMISAIDVIRGLLGLPTKHPQAFPHFDVHQLSIAPKVRGLAARLRRDAMHRHEVSWTDELPLDLRAVDEMPPGGGVLTLVYGPPGEADRLVWAEDAADLGKRFIDMMSAPQKLPLSRWLETPHVRARAASVPDADQRAGFATRLRHLMPANLGA